MKYRERMVAGCFISKSGQTSSLGIVNIAGALTGNSAIRGIATIASGTSVATVSATGVVSGSVIQATMYMSITAPLSIGPAGVHVASVQANLFHIQTVGAINAPQAIPVAWNVIK